MLPPAPPPPPAPDDVVDDEVGPGNPEPLELDVVHAPPAIIAVTGDNQARTTRTRGARMRRGPLVQEARHEERGVLVQLKRSFSPR